MIFQTKFAHKGNFLSKAEQMNVTAEFNIVKLI